jgi:SAM-dependent methyltransferase
VSSSPRKVSLPLVDLGLEAIADKIGPRVVEVGTGSGAIALMIAAERPNSKVYGIDVSHRAIGWARRNGRRLGVENLRFLHGSLLGPLPAAISDADAASAFIFSVLPLALPLFGLEPFHGSAVGVQGGALLVLGAAGTGKSSTAAAMEAGGFDLLADDASAIDGKGHLWPGPPALNPRWGDAQQRVVWRYNAKDVRAPERHPTRLSRLLQP